MENRVDIPQIMQIERPWDPAIPPLGVCSQDLETGPQRGICTHVLGSMFAAVRTGHSLRGHQWMNA